jgi:hypothetical protein
MRWRNFRREYCSVILACKLLRDFKREYIDVTLRAWLYCVWIAFLNTVTRLWSCIIYRDCWLGYVDVILGVNTVPWFWLVNCYVTSRVNIVTWLCELDYTVLGLRLECGDASLVVNNIPWLLAWIRWHNFRREYCSVILACKLWRDFTREKYSDVIFGLQTRSTCPWAWIVIIFVISG